jgi:hypothetical protein
MAAALGLVGRPVGAQENGRTTIAGGYGFLRDLGAGATPSVDYPRGWFVSGTSQLGLARLSAMGELDVNSRRNLAVETQRIQAYLGGARFRLITLWRVQASAHALVGVERFTEPGFSQSGVAFQPGAGVDVLLWRMLGARVQVDYRITHMGQDTFKEFRVGVGAMARLGK